METTTMAASSSGWQTRQVYMMAGFCLLVGLIVGYLFRGSASKHTPSPVPAQSGMPSGSGSPQALPSLEQMKAMADKQAAPLMAQLVSDPNNADLLNRIGQINQATHQFKQAAEYYERSLKIAPKDVAIRTELASCLFYDGETDRALSELETGLKYDPKDANSLFNLGMIRLKGKNDKAGAIAAWEELLKTNPNLDRRPIVEKMIAEAKR
ncbi:MAG TPA: tetratricopeptide repeat protein [Terriglobales bacterium]